MKAEVYSHNSDREGKARKSKGFEPQHAAVWIPPNLSEDIRDGRNLAKAALSPCRL
jgi:hypothetical protein